MMYKLLPILEFLKLSVQRAEKGQLSTKSNQLVRIIICDRIKLL